MSINIKLNYYQAVWSPEAIKETLNWKMSNFKEVITGGTKYIKMSKPMGDVYILVCKMWRKETQLKTLSQEWTFICKIHTIGSRIICQSTNQTKILMRKSS